MYCTCEKEPREERIKVCNFFPLPILTNIDPGQRFAWACIMHFSMPSTMTSKDWCTNPREVTMYTTY